MTNGFRFIFCNPFHIEERRIILETPFTAQILNQISSRRSSSDAFSVARESPRVHFGTITARDARQDERQLNDLMFQ